MSEPRVKRGRNAIATRHAILDSALVAFTRCGYDGVGVREIARGAGVTAILVNRYFGSKEELFEEVVDVIFSEAAILLKELTNGEGLRTQRRNVTRALAAIAMPESTPVDGLQLMVRSVANEQAARILRKKMIQHFERNLADILPGPSPEERAALILSIITGVRLLREIVRIPGLTKADPAALSDALQSLFAVITGSLRGGKTRNGPGLDRPTRTPNRQESGQLVSSIRR